MTPESCLKNQFLLAMPTLAGSYFSNTITYLCEHNDEGAMGIMVNRPSELTLGELFEQLQISTRSHHLDVPVLEGGPVASDRGFILHSTEVSFASSLELSAELMLTTSREVLEAIASGAGPAEFLVALGYAGWGEGQLEEEMKENAWLNAPADRQVLFDTPYDSRVHRAAENLGINFNLLSGHAGHA